ncbi:hypothetical protein [Tuberibacillus calidus]|uniref:hypothetical protein n=1 Tax=Tuberibacillus calidus TaxID=340097 RepID=UPI00041EBD70|nr:hypothetical protein [Tuberibacillus calidus]
MKKFIMMGMAVLLLLGVLAGCSDTKTDATGSKENKKAASAKPAKMLTKEEFDKMLSNPKKYKGAKVDFYAQVFVDPEKDDKGTYLQAFTKPENGEGNVIIGIDDPNLDVKVDDVIHVVGKVKDSFSGENAFGGKIEAPVIVADKIEKSDYVTAFAPALKTVDINKEQDQHGYKMKLTKLEIAENETRIYYEINNTTKDKVEFYDFNAKLVAGNKQYDIKDDTLNYPENQSEILPGVKTQGMLVYPKLDQTSGTLKLNMEVSSENYDLEFHPFQFEIKY